MGFYLSIYLLSQFPNRLKNVLHPDVLVPTIHLILFNPLARLVVDEGGGGGERGQGGMKDAAAVNFLPISLFWASGSGPGDSWLVQSSTFPF